MKSESAFSAELWHLIKTNRSVRMRVARESLYNFAHIYFPDYFEFDTAPFQREIYSLLEDGNVRHLVITAFRGSGKSTIVTTIFPIWAALGRLEKKYALIVSQTQPQARKHLLNIKREFESNEFLRKDFGPLEELSDEWASASVVIPQFNARISAVSTEQSIRGTRHGPYRPDLVISDDVEDLQSVKNSEGREKIYEWYNSEILPVGEKRTKFVLVGNLLHSDSLMMRMKAFTEARQDSRFVYREYPLINESGDCLWPGKYETPQDLEEARNEVASERAWYREYLLKILPDHRQIVKQEDIVTYDQIPDYLAGGSYKIAISVDLAISKTTSADFTGIVTMEKHGSGTDAKIYIHPHPINKRNSYTETVEDIEQLKLLHTSADVYIEDVGMQRSIVEMLDAKHIRSEAVPVGRRDKEERLQVASYWIKKGIVKFPEYGCEKLIQQIVGFGVERDDLLDAFTQGVIRLMESKQQQTAHFGTHPVWTRRMRALNRELDWM